MAAQQRQHRSVEGIIRPQKKRPWYRRWQRAVKRSRQVQGTILACTVLIVAVTVTLIIKQIDTPNYDDVTTMTNALNKHVLLPDEKPILATVTDRSALKTPFLKEANDGDRIVIYPKAKKVIIYRPSVDRIVNIGPVDVNNIPKTTQ